MSRNLLAAILAAVALLSVLPAGAADYVIEISTDGLGSPYLQSLISGGQLPNLARLQSEGAWTNNARNDYDYTVTLPNHVSMVTGLGVTGADGHGWTGNSDPAAGDTLHLNKGSYVTSVFDVAHDNGLRTGLFAGKSKFSLIGTSYNSANGAPDLTGPDNNGTGKIDTYLYNSTTSSLMDSYISTMSANPFNYSLLHLKDPDAAGSWGGNGYISAVKTVDSYVGRILDLVNTNSTLAGKTAIIFTADHGGGGNDHSIASSYLNYTIPFYVWGAGVSANADLYGINAGSRLSPSGSRMPYSASPPPIRNSDGANLALGLLGLPAVPGSTVNFGQNLSVQGTARPARVLAYNAFNEPAIGLTNWTASGTATELSFTTTLLANLTVSPYLGTYDSSSSPRRLRMLGCEARTTFATVDLTNYDSVAVSIDILIKDVATYAAGDYYRAVLTHGADAVTLADVQGTDLIGLDKGIFLHYSGMVPDSWAQATLVVSGRTDTSGEGLDFDHIFFTGTPVPEPTTMVLLLACAATLLGRRRR